MSDEFVIASNEMNTARVSDQVRKLLEIRDLSLRYPAREPGESEILALSGVTLDVKQGEFVSIVGPSGCGKSTLLSAVAGLFLNYQGSISMRGQQLKGPNSEIGVVFQEDSTFPWRSVLRNVEFGLEMKGVPKEERRRKALDALNMVGLQGFVNRYPGQLSGGMKQRVAIARTLVQEPAMLLMDEPFGALDEQTRIILGDELLRIQQNLGQTVLFITHNIQEAVMLSDRVVVLSARPGTIKGIIPIDFSRPRDSTIISSTEFAEKVGQIWSILRDEALKGFNQTEKEV
jgi:NitT/TauT family transport system ATP-binding protein